MKKHKFHIILLILTMICNFSFSQNYINYTEKDGLASNFVYRMRQDYKGFIWFLTDKGISKFDGKTFKNFTVKDGLPANDIWNMRITPNDKIWYFTRSDKLGYIENDSVYSFRANNDAMMNPNGPIFQSGNDISFVNGLYTYRFSDTTWQSIKNQKHRVQLINRDVFLVSDTTIREVQLEDKQGRLLLTLKKDPIHHNYYQFNDSLLVKVHDSYYEIINLNDFKTIYGDLSHLEKNEAPNNRFWFCQSNDKLQLSGGKWLMTFDDKFDVKESYTIPAQLNATQNFQDKDGFIWVATSKNGVYKLPIDYDSIATYFEGKKISKITEIDSVVYVGVEEDGVYKLEDNKPKLWLKEKIRLYNLSILNKTICYNFRFHIVLDNGGVFKKIENSTVQFNTTLLPYQESFFTGGSTHLVKLNKNFDLLKEFNDHPYYQGLFEQNDSLFSFSYKQLLFYDIEKDVFSDYKKEQIQQKLLTNTTFNNQTYIGTEGDGLYRFSDGRLQKLIQNDKAVINQISVENPNSIWAVSEGALLHYMLNQADGFIIERFNQINGLPTNNLTEVLFYNNQLYLGSTTGLNIIYKKEIRRTIDFTPYIKSVYVNGKKIQGDSSLEYEYDSNLNFKINFGSINFFDSNNTTFQYLLSPVQNTWTTTEFGEVNLYDLQPNDYKLQLQVNHNNVVKFKEISIKILPKWWQTGLLAVLMTTIIIVVLMAFIFFTLRHFRNKLLQERRLAQLELRALRSQMNPHFVHNSLNAIQYYIQRHEVELSEGYLAKFSKLIRLFFEYSRKRTITIKEEIQLLHNYLEVEKLRFEDKLKYKIVVDKQIDEEEQLIPSMILQPIVENAVNHGLFHKDEGGTIIVNFKYLSDSGFKVIIEDDGIGVNRAKEIYTKSTRNFQSRSSDVLEERLELLRLSKEWNVTYTIQDRSEFDTSSGTLVTLIFNQHQDL